MAAEVAAHCSLTVVAFGVCMTKQPQVPGKLIARNIITMKATCGPDLRAPAKISGHEVLITLLGAHLSHCADAWCWQAALAQANVKSSLQSSSAGRTTFLAYGKTGL